MWIANCVSSPIVNLPLIPTQDIIKISGSCVKVLYVFRYGSFFFTIPESFYWQNEMTSFYT